MQPQNQLPQVKQEEPYDFSLPAITRVNQNVDPDKMTPEVRAMWSTYEMGVLLDHYAQIGNRFDVLSAKMRENIADYDEQKYSEKKIQMKLGTLIKTGLIIFMKNLKNNPQMAVQFDMLKHALKKSYPERLLNSPHELNSESKIMLIRLNFCKKIPPSNFDQLFEFIKEPRTTKEGEVEEHSDDQDQLEDEKPYQVREREQKIRLIRQLRVCNKKLQRARFAFFNQNPHSEQNKQQFEDLFMKYTKILQDTIKKTGKRYASRIEPKMFQFTFSQMYRKDFSRQDQRYEQIVKKIFTRMDRLHKQKVFAKIDLIRLYRAIRGVFREKQMREKRQKYAIQKKKRDQVEEQSRRKMEKIEDGQKDAMKRIQSLFAMKCRKQNRGMHMRKFNEKDNNSEDQISSGSSLEQQDSRKPKKKKASKSGKRSKKDVNNEDSASVSQRKTVSKPKPKSNKAPWDLQNLDKIEKSYDDWSEEEELHLLKQFLSLGKYLGGLVIQMRLKFEKGQQKKFEQNKLEIKLISFIYKGLLVLNQMNRVRPNEIKLTSEVQNRLCFKLASKVYDENTLDNAQKVRKLLMNLCFRKKPQQRSQYAQSAEFLQKVVAKNAVDRCEALFKAGLGQNKNFRYVSSLMKDTGTKLKLYGEKEAKQLEEMNKHSNGVKKAENSAERMRMDVEEQDKGKQGGSKVGVQENEKDKESQTNKGQAELSNENQKLSPEQE